MAWRLSPPLLVLSCGCGPTIAPRTADTAAAGAFTLAASMTPVHVGWGQARSSAAQAPSSEYTGGADFYPESDTFPWGWSVATFYQLELRYGLAPWAETGLMVGYQRIGGEARVALLDEHAGQPLSLAWSYGAAYSAIGNGPWMRTGFDLSRHLGPVVPLLDVYLSREMTVHTAHEGELPCPPEGWPGAMCGVFVAERQLELRLSAAAGLGIQIDRSVLVVGAAPYVPLASKTVGCPSCEGEVRPEWGLHVVIGVEAPLGD